MVVNAATRSLGILLNEIRYDRRGCECVAWVCVVLGLRARFYSNRLERRSIASGWVEEILVGLARSFFPIVNAGSLVRELRGLFRRLRRLVVIFRGGRHVDLIFHVFDLGGFCKQVPLVCGCER